MCRFFDDVPRSKIEFLIDEWIHDQRDRQIIARRIIDGLTFEKLGEEFDLSVTQIKTICYKAQRKLLEHV